MENVRTFESLTWVRLHVKDSKDLVAEMFYNTDLNSCDDGSTLGLRHYVIMASVITMIMT